jgi:3-oxoacyl-[acyl-carrier protein] reductase
VSLPLSDQIVLVSGAGRGLGASIAEAFAREGAAVAVNWRRSGAEAEALAERLGPRARAFQADVTDPAAVRAMVAAVTDGLGPPTTLVHNALAAYSFDGDARASLATLTGPAIADQMAVAVQGAVNLMQAVAPAMAAAGFGRIVTIGSNLVWNPVVPYHDYTAAKAALMGLTRTAARELGPRRITVNMVAGGLLRVTDASRATPEAVFDLIAASTPLGRVTTPGELAEAVLFFASPWARAVTGQTLIVDGGLVMG